MIQLAPHSGPFAADWPARFDALLPFVQKPARYVGGEFNQKRKDPRTNPHLCVLAFPDVYEIGMSNLGLQVIAGVLNALPGWRAERAFLPWIDLEPHMRRERIPLHTLENKSPVRDAEVLGITLQTESTYVGVVNLLDLAGIPIRSEHRTMDDPIVIVGGEGATEPEPIAPFFDLAFVGDGEVMFAAVCQAIAERRKDYSNRLEFLRDLVRDFPVLYCPQGYQFTYDGPRIAHMGPRDGFPALTDHALLRYLSRGTLPLDPLVPHIQAVHERITIEVMRGCVHGCRFCHAGYVKRPIRYREADEVRDIAVQTYRNTGFDDVAMTSLSTSDYPPLFEAMEKVYAALADQHVSISLPSLRVNEQLRQIPGIVGRVRKSGLTMAPEVASDRLRKVINKPILNADLIAGAEAAFKAGWKMVKLYTMVGCPTETEEDVREVGRLARAVSEAARASGKKPAEVHVAVSPFVPKGHTPFQWAPMASAEYFQQAMRWVQEEIPEKRFRWDFHDYKKAQIEGALSRGDRRQADVVEKAHELGVRFDAWGECFDHAKWMEAYAHFSPDIHPDTVNQRERSLDEPLPWDQIDASVRKVFLQREWKKALAERTTENCFTGKCFSCGVKFDDCGHWDTRSKDDAVAQHR